MSNTIKIGALSITLQRTIRVPDGRIPAELPPGLGAFPVYKVADFQDKCPEFWEAGGYFIPMHDTEATWISLRCAVPRAVMVGAGGVNAITGKSLALKLEAGNYLVVPPQPWIDGWKSDEGDAVFQFTATPFLGGEGITVGEQILGKESKTGGIGIAVFPPKDPKLAAQSGLHEFPIAGAYDTNPWQWQNESYTMTASLSLGEAKGLRSAKFSEAGVGKGGRIRQKLYPDPYLQPGQSPAEIWLPDAEATIAIYLVLAQEFAEITGLPVPALPPHFDKYAGPYFALPDEAMPDTQGAGVFVGLKSVFYPASGTNAPASPEGTAETEAV